MLCASDDTSDCQRQSVDSDWHSKACPESVASQDPVGILPANQREGSRAERMTSWYYVGRIDKIGSWILPQMIFWQLRSPLYMVDRQLFQLGHDCMSRDCLELAENRTSQLSRAELSWLASLDMQRVLELEVYPKSWRKDIFASNSTKDWSAFTLGEVVWRNCTFHDWS